MVEHILTAILKHAVGSTVTFRDNPSGLAATTLRTARTARRTAWLLPRCTPNIRLWLKLSAVSRVWRRLLPACWAWGRKRFIQNADGSLYKLVYELNFERHEMFVYNEVAIELCSTPCRLFYDYDPVIRVCVGNMWKELPYTTCDKIEWRITSKRGDDTVMAHASVPPLYLASVARRHAQHFLDLPETCLAVSVRATNDAWVRRVFLPGPWNDPAELDACMHLIAKLASDALLTSVRITEGYLLCYLDRSGLYRVR